MHRLGKFTKFEEFDTLVGYLTAKVNKPTTVMAKIMARSLTVFEMQLKLCKSTIIYSLY